MATEIGTDNVSLTDEELAEYERLTATYPHATFFKPSESKLGVWEVHTRTLCSMDQDFLVALRNFERHPIKKWSIRRSRRSNVIGLKLSYEYRITRAELQTRKRHRVCGI